MPDLATLQLHGNVELNVSNAKHKAFHYPPQAFLTVESTAQLRLAPAPLNRPTRQSLDSRRHACSTPPLYRCELSKVLLFLQIC